MNTMASLVWNGRRGTRRRRRRRRRGAQETERGGTGGRDKEQATLQGGAIRS